MKNGNTVVSIFEGSLCNSLSLQENIIYLLRHPKYEYHVHNIHCPVVIGKLRCSLVPIFAILEEYKSSDEATEGKTADKDGHYKKPFPQAGV